jgi:molybdopterin/thiamine biosynthesis adenylyltransferase
LNRLVGARHDDPIPGTAKVHLGARLAVGINQAIEVEPIKDSLVSKAALSAIARGTHIFGCLDSEGARLILNEWCAAYAKPYIDLASDILPGDLPSYGGRVCVAWNGNGCLACLSLLDVAEAQEELEGHESRKQRAAIYGVNKQVLDRSGPSVISINGVIASLAVTEFIVAVTRLRSPHRFLNYYGTAGKVTVSNDVPREDCYYCKGIRGNGDATDPTRYVRERIGVHLR